MMRLCGHETFGSSLCRDIDVRLALEVVKRVALHSVAVVLNFRFAHKFCDEEVFAFIKLYAIFIYLYSFLCVKYILYILL